PLFEGGAKATRAAVMRIITDSRQPGEPKDAEASHLYTLYRAFATPEQSSSFRNDLEQGLSWGDAKDQLFNLIETEVGPMRAQYEALMANPERIEEILQAGAIKARKLALPLMERLREAVGLRSPSVAKRAAEPIKAGGKKARF